MKFIEKPEGEFEDKKIGSDIQPIDVIMATLDAENFLERCLFSAYREIPIRKLIICDGGSKDKTIDILNKFPRVEVFIKPEIHTGGKLVEFLISKVETEWFAFIDSDIILADGWFNEMRKFQNSFDVVENSKTILAYHFYREFNEKLQYNSRPSHFCHLAKKDALCSYKCDDDYMYRFTDYLFRQSIETSGYRYGKVDSTYHTHNETERIPYESDLNKNFIKIVMKEPERIILDKEKNMKMSIENAMAIVKYLDPDNSCIKKNKKLNESILLLDRRWIEENGKRWIEVYDKSKQDIKIKKVKQFLKKIKQKFNF